MAQLSGPIIITGCSSGIGRATALRLLGSGHTVYATARSLDSLGELAAAGAHALALDVTDEDSMVAAVALVERAHGAVAGLVNNAGYGEYGPVEEVSMERVRRQFETNVFGLARMIQLVLPAMRAARAGRIVNVSSMGGRMVLPLGGYYHASKYAVEALSDALRAEVGQFGIEVTLIEPGSIKTEFNATANRTLESQQAATSGPYSKLKQGQLSALDSPMNARIAGDADDVAKAIEHALTTRRPRPRYIVTPAARAMILGHAVLPARTWDAVGRRVMGS